MQSVMAQPRTIVLAVHLDTWELSCAEPSGGTFTHVIIIKTRQISGTNCVIGDSCCQLVGGEEL